MASHNMGDEISNTQMREDYEAFEALKKEVAEAENFTAGKLFEKLKYDMVSKLGQGGMGVAYRARSLRDGTTRVLKLNLHYNSSGDQEDSDLLQEGELLKSLLGLDCVSQVVACCLLDCFLFC